MSNSNYKKNKNLVASRINELNLTGDGRIYGKTYTNDLQVIGNTTTDNMIVTDKITTPTIVTAKLEAYNPNALQQSDYVIDVSNHTLDKVEVLNVNELNATSLGSELDAKDNNIIEVNNIGTKTINATTSITTPSLTATTSITTPSLSATLGADLNANQQDITNIKELKGNDTDPFNLKNVTSISGPSATSNLDRKIDIDSTTLEFGDSLCISGNEITPTDFSNYTGGTYAPGDFLFLNGSIDMTRKDFILDVGGDISTYNGTIKTNKIDSVTSTGSTIDFNNTTLDNVNSINVNSLNKGTSTSIKINDDLDLLGTGAGKNIKNVNTISTFNINIDGDKFDPNEYEKVEGYSFDTVNVQVDDWITLARCSDGVNSNDLRADALFVLEERDSGKHQCITFRSGGKFSSGLYINILQNSCYSNSRFKKLRIAYGTTNSNAYSGFLLQVQVNSVVTSSGPSDIVNLRVYQNRNEKGWYSPRYTPPTSSGGGQGPTINTPDPRFPETSVISVTADNAPEGYIPNTTLYQKVYPNFLESSELNNIIDNQRSLISFTSPVEALTSMYTPKASVTNLLRYDSNQPLNVGATTTNPSGTEYIKANEPIVFKNNTNLSNTVTYLNSMSQNTKEGAVVYSRDISSTTQNSDTFLNEFVLGGGDKTPVYMSTPTKYTVHVILDKSSGSTSHSSNDMRYYLTMSNLTYYDMTYSYEDIGVLGAMSFGADGFCDRIIVHPVKHQVQITGIIGNKRCAFEIWGVNASSTRNGTGDAQSNTQTENAVKFYSSTITSYNNNVYDYPFNRIGSQEYDAPRMHKSSTRLKIYKEDTYYFLPITRNTSTNAFTLTYLNKAAGTQSFSYAPITFIIDILANIHCDV